MKKIMPFEKKVKQKFDTLLEGAGFKAHKESIEGDMKAVVYQSKDKISDIIIFNVMLQGDYDASTNEYEFNWLRVQVSTLKNQFDILPQRQLVPSGNIYGTLGWLYQDEEGLEESLLEMDQIIQSNLSAWFKDE